MHGDNTSTIDINLRCQATKNTQQEKKLTIPNVNEILNASFCDFQITENNFNMQL